MTIRYEVVKCSENLFRVFSHVTAKGFLGHKTEIKNFVAECETEEQAKNIVDALNECK